MLTRFLALCETEEFFEVPIDQIKAWFRGSEGSIYAVTHNGRTPRYARPVESMLAMAFLRHHKKPYFVRQQGFTSRVSSHIR